MHIAVRVVAEDIGVDSVRIMGVAEYEDWLRGLGGGRVLVRSGDDSTLVDSAGELVVNAVALDALERHVLASLFGGDDFGGFPECTPARRLLTGAPGTERPPGPFVIGPSAAPTRGSGRRWPPTR